MVRLAGRIISDDMDEEIGVEEVISHGDEGHVGLARYGERILGLFLEPYYPPVFIDLHHAEG